MTASVGHEVDGTVSAVGGYSTGLPGVEADEAGREQFAELGDLFTAGQAIWG